jgi:hypothetical protein
MTFLFPALVYFFFIFYGGQRASFNRLIVLRDPWLNVLFVEVHGQLLAEMRRLRVWSRPVAIAVNLSVESFEECPGSLRMPSYLYAGADFIS